MTLVYGPDFIKAITALLPLAGSRKTAEVHVACSVTGVTVSAASAGLGGIVRLGVKHPDRGDGEVHEFILTPDQVSLLGKAYPVKDLIDRDAWLKIERPEDHRIVFALENAGLGDRLELALAGSLRSPGDLATVVLDDYRNQAEAADPGDRQRVLQLDPDRARIFLSATKHIAGDVDLRQAEEGAPIIGNIGSTLAGYMMPAGWFPDKTDDPEHGVISFGVTADQSTIFDQLKGAQP